MTEELKMCPFCHPADVKERHRPLEYIDHIGMERVRCGLCGCDQSKTNWQDRPFENALRAENEKLKSIIADFFIGFDVDAFGVLANGNEAQGVDEGIVRGTDYLLKLRTRFDALKGKAVNDE